MDRGPESSAPTDLVEWIAYERDAAWTAKLAILRAKREDIAHFGACLREHERHADELARLARMDDRSASIPTEATFVTREPHVVGAIADGYTLLEAMEQLETVRVRRYETRGPVVTADLATMIEGVLERHCADARARLACVRRLREPSKAAA